MLRLWVGDSADRLGDELFCEQHFLDLVLHFVAVLLSFLASFPFSKLRLTLLFCGPSLRLSLLVRFFRGVPAVVLLPAFLGGMVS